MQFVVDSLLAENTLRQLLGDEPRFRKSIECLPHIARGKAPVLIQGETGTGKELVARAVHYLSPRAAHPFVPLNCGSISESLIEPELFGHERGAFTNAYARRKGVLDQADRGTLFLDEVDSLAARRRLRYCVSCRRAPIGP